MFREQLTQQGLTTRHSRGTFSHLRIEDGELKHLVSTNVETHLRNAKRDRELSPHRLTHANQEYQVLGTIPPSVVMLLKDKGYDMFATDPDEKERAMKAAERWLKDNPLFLSTNKRF